jgi:hypothetical protein
MTIDEQRQAWRFYAAALLAGDDVDLQAVVKAADWMVQEERKRFGHPDHIADAGEMVEPPAWVSAQFRPLDLSVTAPFVNTGQPPEPRPWMGLTDEEISELTIWFRCSAGAGLLNIEGLLCRADDLLREKNGGTR